MYGITLNYIAIVVAAVVAFIIGGLWYSPFLFGNAWVKAHGFGEADLARMKTQAGRSYITMFALTIVMAAVLAILIGLTGIVRWQGGAKLGALCWLGFAATIGLSSAMFGGKKLTTYFIDASYQLVYIVVMGALLAAWR